MFVAQMAFVNDTRTFHGQQESERLGGRLWINWKMLNSIMATTLMPAVSWWTSFVPWFRYGST